LVLYDGAFYEDLTRQQKKASDRKKYPAMKTTFKEHIINIDISDLNKVDLDQTSISSAYHMLNVLDLRKEIDTLKNKTQKTRKAFSEEIIRRNKIKNIDSGKISLELARYKDIYQIIKDTTIIKSRKLMSIYSLAEQKANSLHLFTKRKNEYFKHQQIKRNKYIHAFFEKFTYPIMVIVMFLVGIPLGAIIRKGGFGISVVFGIIIFVTYYILSMLGKNAAEEGAVPPYLGAWFAVAVLLPLGIYLTYKANNDNEFSWFAGLMDFFRKHFTKNKQIS
jgi:lipopolysaccharide export system permease protein